MKDKTFKNDAKQIVDMCFDTKIFKENITRDDMNVFEEHITYLLQSRFESYKKLSSLMDRVNKLPEIASSD